MMGMPAELWSNELFDRVLPELGKQLCPEVPYAPSSPCGGAMPFYSGAGLSHYYGVGAYLRPLDDARITRVRFASECLAFSNVPEDSSLLAWLGDTSAPAHSPRYKERVPRDGGAGWDFADVTDHYVELLFGVEARRLRYADHDRYLALCRAATGEVMARVQGMWRRRDSSCRGALIWFLRDLWQGAGWGVVDAGGTPKAAYHYLRRAWARVALWFSDEGVDGLLLHADNEGPAAVSGRLELVLYRADGAIGERAETSFDLPPRGQRSLSVEALLGRFVDSSYAFRFGPPAFPVVVARWLPHAPGAEPLAEAFHLPLGLGHEPQPDVGLTASAVASGDGSYVVSVSAERFAQSVSIEARGYLPSDDYFHLAPRVPHRLRLLPMLGAPALRGRVRALNATTAAVLQVTEEKP
jgi:beta-mannosidase